MPLAGLDCWMRRRGRRLARLIVEEDGATAVEFSLVTTPFFGFVLLILTVGVFHFSVQSLDFAVKQAGRQIMTAQVAATASSASTFKSTYICPKLFWSIACDKLVVNSYKVGKSSDPKASTGIYEFIDATSRTLHAPATVPAQQRFCLGGPGDYIYLDVAYPYPNYLKRLLSSIAPDTFLMRSSTMVFNEPGKKNAGSTC
jgi:Flp pilus assembly protein TadG